MARKRNRRQWCSLGAKIRIRSSIQRCRQRLQSRTASAAAAPPDSSGPKPFPFQLYDYGRPRRRALIQISVKLHHTKPSTLAPFNAPCSGLCDINPVPPSSRGHPKPAVQVSSRLDIPPGWRNWYGRTSLHMALGFHVRSPFKSVFPSWPRPFCGALLWKSETAGKRRQELRENFLDGLFGLAQSTRTRSLLHRQSYAIAGRCA
jgi:hypothetical protein